MTRLLHYTARATSNTTTTDRTMSISSITTSHGSGEYYSSNTKKKWVITTPKHLPSLRIILIVFVWIVFTEPLTSFVPPLRLQVLRNGERQIQYDAITPTTTTTSSSGYTRYSHCSTPVFRRSKTIRSSSSSSSSSTDTTVITAPNSASSTAGFAIKIDGLTCSLDGTTYLLNNINYSLPRNSKIGLLGRNGSGKSTFLKLLARATATTTKSITSAKDENLSFTGAIEKAKTCRVAYVEQEPPPAREGEDVTVGCALFGITAQLVNDPTTTIISTNKISTPYEAAQHYTLAEYNHNNYNHQQQQENTEDIFLQATLHMDRISGSWSILTKAEEIATKLQIHHLWQMPVSKLSGGERKRVSLAAALLTEPDVLLLDEITNYLDLSAIQWVTDFILGSTDPSGSKKMTVLVVTHDRAFLDQVCRDGILELDQGHLYPYVGTYADFCEAKAARLADQEAQLQSNLSKYRLEYQWMKRQPQGRQTKAKFRIDAFAKLQKAIQLTSKVVSSSSSYQLSPLGSSSSGGGGSSSGTATTRRLGNTVLECKGLSLSFPIPVTDNIGSSTSSSSQQRQFLQRCIIHDFTYDFNSGDRIGIVGRNGVGKSTFLNILTGKQPVDSGEIIKGETVVFGIYDQLGLQDFDDDQRLLDYVKERVIASDGSSVMAETPQEARKLLQKWEFPRNRWNERVATLSGGERRRLQLLTVLTKRPNFLILDEPTSDLDSDTIAALEQYLLEEFKGVLVVVSHDRYFTDKVTDHLFILEGDGAIVDYSGSLSAYAETLVTTTTTISVSGTDDNNDTREQMAIPKKEDKEKRTAKMNLRQKYTREMASLEQALEKLKAESAALQGELDKSTNDGWSVLADLTEKISLVTNEIIEKENRWLELAEFLEQEDIS